MRQKHFIDKNVLEASKERLRTIHDMFDTVVVMFSGGKDSLVTLHLWEEVYRELGHTDKIKVCFRDEELIPDDVIAFVTEYYKSGKYDMVWYAVPTYTSKYVLGKMESVLLWNPDRKWIRDKPDWAIKDAGGQIFDQDNMDEEIAKNYKGKICFLTGQRCQESFFRLKSVLLKPNLPFISRPFTQDSRKRFDHVMLGKPIYDWDVKDVFRYMYDRQIKYCPIYDNQTWNETPLRVSTPLHAESARTFWQVRTLYPVFYQQIVTTFPEMILQEKYHKEYDKFSKVDNYERSWSGIIRYIRENIDDPDNQKKAIKRVMEAKTMRENALKSGKTRNSMGGYPLLHVFETIVRQNYEHVIQAMPDPPQRFFDYEAGKDYRHLKARQSEQMTNLTEVR